MGGAPVEGAAVAGTEPDDVAGEEIVLSLFTTITTFGTPRDITVEELSVELFFPADDSTAYALGSRGSV